MDLPRASDDSDPNGLWYLYRTDAVLWAGDQSFWWDYPGFGYDGDAYYITANLFGLNQGGWGGVGLRVFKRCRCSRVGRRSTGRCATAGRRSCSSCITRARTRRRTS